MVVVVTTHSGCKLAFVEFLQKDHGIFLMIVTTTESIKGAGLKLLPVLLTDNA